MSRPLQIGLAMFVVVAVWGGRKIVGGTTDFDVILDAAGRFSAGGDIYAIEPGRPEQFWYPGWIVLLPRLLMAWFGERGAELVFALVCAAATVAMAFDLRRISRRLGFSIRPIHVVVLAALFGRCLTNNFSNGQISVLIGALMTHATHALLVGQPVRAGVAIGFASGLKVTPALLLIALPFCGIGAAAWSAVAAGAATIAALLLVVPWPFVGFETHVAWLRGFVDLALSPFHDDLQVNLQQARSASVIGTLDHVLREPKADAGGFYWVDLGDRARRVILVSWSLVLVACTAWGLRTLRNGLRAAVVSREVALGVQVALVLMLTALLSPQTKPYHFLHHAWAAWLFVLWMPGSRHPGVAARLPTQAWIAVAGMFALAMPLRQRSLLGVEWWRALDECGLLHLALVGQLILLAVGARRLCSPKAPVSLR